MQSLGKKMLSKYTLYLICFLALNLIEFLRATQPGNIWSAAANCTGPVMMVIIFSQLPIRDFLKPANYVYTAICALAVGAVYFHWTGHMGEYYFGQMATAVINIWWLGLVIRWFFRKIIEEERRKGTTIFLTTHNMLDADLLCDRVAFLTDGRIAALDTPKNLKEKNSSRNILVEYLHQGQRKNQILKPDEVGKAFSFLYDEILQVHSQEPTLEDIFLQYTGRGLQ